MAVPELAQKQGVKLTLETTRGKLISVVVSSSTLVTGSRVGLLLFVGQSLAKYLLTASRKTLGSWQRCGVYTSFWQYYAADLEQDNWKARRKRRYQSASAVRHATPFCHTGVPFYETCDRQHIHPCFCTSIRFAFNTNP